MFINTKKLLGEMSKLNKKEDVGKMDDINSDANPSTFFGWASKTLGRAGAWSPSVVMHLPTSFLESKG